MAQQSSTDTGLLVTESWPIERVIPYARNPRKLTDAQVAGVAGSLKQFKFRQPLVVDAEGVLIVGHTRLQAARQLGWTHVPVHVAHDMSPAYPLEAWTVEDAKAVGFEHVKTDRFVMPARMGSPEDDEPATEPVIVLRKPK